MIDASLGEILVGGLSPREQVLGRAAAERVTVRTRKQRVEVRRDRRMESDRAGRQNAHSRVVIGNSGDAGNP